MFSINYFSGITGSPLIVILGFLQAPMSEIDIYDLAEGFWYTQKATGLVPETRRLFCAGVGTAVDGSSHNVYGSNCTYGMLSY